MFLVYIMIVSIIIMIVTEDRYAAPCPLAISGLQRLDEADVCVFLDVIGPCMTGSPLWSHSASDRLSSFMSVNHHKAILFRIYVNFDIE